jgi:parallel beta-helix repeat protein
MNFKVLISAILASTIAIVGCESDSTSGGGGSGGSGGTAGSGGAGGVDACAGSPEAKTCADIPDTSSYIVPNAPPTTPDCDMTLNPTGTDDHAQIIDALVDNDLTNKTLCLGVGLWDMGGTIGITDDPGLTLVGLGDSPDDVVLDYADENFDCRGTVGIGASADDVTVENLWVKNTCANGVEARGWDGSVLTKVRVSWDDRCEGPRARDNCGESCDCQGDFAPDNCGESCDCNGLFAPDNCGESCDCQGLFAPDNCDADCTEDADCDDGRLVCEGDKCVPNDATYCSDVRLTCNASGECAPNNATYCEDDRLTCGASGDCAPDKKKYCDDDGLTCGGESTCVTNMTFNGAYGIYPTDCTNTLVEYSQVEGASDAGIYIGKCTGGSVENNIVYENVAGLEVENCVGVSASNNDAFNNVGGLFALQQDISGDMQSNSDVRLFDNQSYCNNHDNFAKSGSAVAGIPVGTGILSFAGDGVEIFCNTITDNLTLGIGFSSNVLNCQVGGDDCPPYTDGYNPYVKNNYTHDNTFTNNGTDPQGLYGALFKSLGFGTADGPPVPEVVWDGYKEAPEADPGFCLGTDAEAVPTILVIGDPCQTPIDPSIPDFITCAQDNVSTDPAPYLCEPSPE